MSCRASVELMSLRLDGLLGPPDAVRLEEHLHTCADCAAQWTALREADMLLRLSARRPVAPPIDFQARVMQRVAVTPVARPQLWERERLQIEGGRRTVKLGSTGPISGHRVPVPAGFAAAPPAPAGLLAHFQPLREGRMRLYLGGLSVAGALSVLLLIVFSTVLTPGLTQLSGWVQNTLLPGGTTGQTETWLTAFWSLVSSLLAQVNPWLVTAATLIVTGLSAAWWRIVSAFARRAGNREVIA